MIRELQWEFLALTLKDQEQIWIDTQRLETALAPWPREEPVRAKKPVSMKKRASTREAKTKKPAKKPSSVAKKPAKRRAAPRA